MTDAVIVSTARTPIGKAYRGALNATEGATLLGHAISEAVARAKVDPKEVEVTRQHWPFLRDRRIDAYGGITSRFLD